MGARAFAGPYGSCSLPGKTVMERIRTMRKIGSRRASPERAGYFWTIGSCAVLAGSAVGARSWAAHTTVI
jgi:hypothetical protein